MLSGEPTLIKEKTLINSQPQITLSIDASLEGWGLIAMIKRQEVLGHLRRKKII